MIACTQLQVFFMNMKTDQLTESGYYQTADLSCAAALALSFPIESVDRTNTRRSYFIFARTEALDETVRQYQRGELLVEPRSYFNAIKDLKVRLYEPTTQW